MTALYKVTKWFTLVIVWIISAIVALAFVISLVWFLNIGPAVKELPTSLADLQKVTITVKTAIITKSPQFITPVEYPTKFTIDGQIAPEVVAKHPINNGDRVDIYVTKKEAKILEESTPIRHFKGQSLPRSRGEPATHSQGEIGRCSRA
jgi:hypothetical protein